MKRVKQRKGGMFLVNPKCADQFNLEPGNLAAARTSTGGFPKTVPC